MPPKEALLPNTSSSSSKRDVLEAGWSAGLGLEKSWSSSSSSSNSEAVLRAAGGAATGFGAGAGLASSNKLDPPAGWVVAAIVAGAGAVVLREGGLRPLDPVAREDAALAKGAPASCSAGEAAGGADTVLCLGA